ncbi:response regulator transcription factor [Malaciobacter pacificus]|uniref:Two-component system response regulator n=1 Tax=Malaciobacter pacificus TaxID=1080223 RepID=A0A5C2HAN1_9BACT|nr:response regulator [Malaciobacter pacificus]QEP35419.1 two-component system response regulator [Malaciobacter pacificus]
MVNYNNIKVLVVEDDDIARENAVELLQDYFENIYESNNAIDAFKIYKEKNPHIIITDIQMPKLNGLEFVSKIREKDDEVQIIILTAFCDKDYLLRAVELKLVKYLVKPVNEKELEKALKTACDNIIKKESNIILLDKNTKFDMYNLTLVCNDELIKLRSKEIDFIYLLLKNKNRYVTYSEIESFVWDGEVMSKDALKTLVKNIKKKIPKELISNLTGTGYKVDIRL